MFKKLAFAVVALAFVAYASNAFAGDILDDVANMSVESISDASMEVQTASLDVDVDSLTSSESKNDEAIEACFRHFGGGYNYGCYNYNYYNCYRPCYSYSYCYRPVYYTYCYRPVVHYSCYTPCYTSYWGCY